jgi:hypothetical protein
MNILKNVKRLIKQRAALQAEINKIDAILAPLGSVDGGTVKAAAAKTGQTSGRRRMSAEARARISAAAKARWKKAKAAGKTRL